MYNKIIKAILNLIIILGLIYCYSFITLLRIPNYIKIIMVVSSVLLLAISLIFKIYNYNKTSKVFYLIYITYSITLITYAVLVKYNIIQVLSSVSALKDYILETKGNGVLVYILIQLLQVIFLPIPASVICVVGSLIYGPFLGGLYCCIGVLIGSYVSYFLGRVFGKKLVSWIVGKSNADKYTELISKKGCVFLIIAFLLPLFPDDILCLIAGISNIKFKNFFLITLITRPIGVICMSYFGSGQLIPFNGWGVYVWLGILLIAIITIIIIYKYQEKLQKYVLNKIIKNKNKN